MNHVIRRTCLSALVLAAMAVFAGCAAETGDTSTDGDTSERTGAASDALTKVGNPPPPVGTVTVPTSVPDDIMCHPGSKTMDCRCDSDVHCAGIDGLCHALGAGDPTWNGTAWGCTVSTL